MCPCICAYLLQHAGSELHGLMVLLLQHIHVEVIQEVVPVIIHPALVELRPSGEKGGDASLDANIKYQFFSPKKKREGGFVAHMLK